MNSYRFSCDSGEMQIDVIHRFLTNSYWSPGVSKDIVQKALKHSLCFGVFCADQQVGFARVITDKTTFAYLSDVFILPEHRGLGLAKKLMDYLVKHDELQGLRRFMLATRDAHGLYQQFGFEVAENSTTLMQQLNPDIYQQS